MIVLVIILLLIIIMQSIIIKKVYKLYKQKAVKAELLMQIMEER